MTEHPGQASPMPSTPTPSSTPPAVALAEGDGIGPEIVAATVAVLEAAGAKLDFHPVKVGEQVYREGHAAGISPDGWTKMRSCRVLLKGPITTPQGGGYKSVNVSIRKRMGLFANVRPCVAYHPFISTRFPELDVVVIRENEEDTYGGIEHRQTAEVNQCLKLITRPGCERIARHAFEYARAHGRKRITCLTKDNIMKLTDGLFHRVFDEIAAEYPDIESNHQIIDIGTARLATRPGDYDVALLPNLYGDIVSDVLAEMGGSVGLAASANLGERFAMFEAIHGSAPDIAGQGIANPSGLLLAAVMMLVHLGQGEVATRIHNAWLRTIETGVATGDIYSAEHSSRRVGTGAFAEAVIANLGEQPQQLGVVDYRTITAPTTENASASAAAKAPGRPEKQLLGVDIFVDWDQPGRDPAQLAERLRAAVPAELELGLEMITNRGTTVWPHGLPETFCTDHWRCRFRSKSDSSAAVPATEIVMLQVALLAGGIEIIKTENLYSFDGEPGFSRGQG